MLYISNNNDMWGIKKGDKKDIIEVLIKEKPKYSNEDCDPAFDNLIESNYIITN